MVKYIFKRFLYMAAILFFMSLILFFLYNLIPGDPARAELESQKQYLTPEEYQVRYETLREEMGLDRPILVRYGNWIGGILTGNFGYSRMYKSDVVNVIREPFKNTVFINLFAVSLSLLITIPLGIFCASHKKSVLDSAVQIGTIVGYSLPVFIIGLVSIYLFAVKLQWFPVSGMNTPGFEGTGFAAFADRMHYLALPLLVMTAGSLGSMTRYVRAAMIEALSQDYIRTARAKGLKERAVIYSHAWRNALLPVITLIIGWFLTLFSGSIVVENMFGINGMGQLMYKGLMNQDYDVVLIMQMFYMLLALVGNLLVDLSYGLVDPRIRVTR